MSVSMPAGTVANATSQLKNQDVGIKISQPGFNAQSASPLQLIFDSSWPSVASAFTKLLPIGSSGTVAHNLGYPPFTRVYTLNASGSITSATAASVDSSNVYIQSGVTTSLLFVDCSNINLGVDIDYPGLPTVAVNNAYDNNYGIKVSKEHKSTTSKDGRDFILHSRYRSPLIQAVKTQATMNSGNATATGGTIGYINASGNATWNYGFIKVAAVSASTLNIPVGAYAFAAYYNQAYPRTFTDGITSYIQYVANDTGATLVILRDPFFAPTITQAFY